MIYEEISLFVNPFKKLIQEFINIKEYHKAMNISIELHKFCEIFFGIFNKISANNLRMQSLIYEKTRDKHKTIMCLQTSLDIYEFLNDKKMVKRIREKLGKIKN